MAQGVYAVCVAASPHMAVMVWEKERAAYLSVCEARLLVDAAGRICWGWIASRGLISGDWCCAAAP